MITLKSVKEIRQHVAQEHGAGHRVGFVPTMGNLHDGHMALVDVAREMCDYVVVSIFVNPMQFGANEDLDTYPRTLDEDSERLLAAGVDCIFTPNARTMYPETAQTRVTVPGLSEVLCGVSRPQFFIGVATVCVKLFNIVQPDIAVFGEKDWQQLTIIRHVVSDLHLPMEIIGVPTGRAADGLALSSRNSYLSEEERAIAPGLYQTLVATSTQLAAGNTDYPALEETAIAQLDSIGFRHDYLQIVNRHTLAAPGPQDKELAIIAAAHLGKARLIDNLHVDIP